MCPAMRVPGSLNISPGPILTIIVYNSHVFHLSGHICIVILNTHFHTFAQAS
jgi:hypothetical protein